MFFSVFSENWGRGDICTYVDLSLLKTVVHFLDKKKRNKQVRGNKRPPIYINKFSFKFIQVSKRILINYANNSRKNENGHHQLEKTAIGPTLWGVC